MYGSVLVRSLLRTSGSSILVLPFFIYSVWKVIAVKIDIHLLVTTFASCMRKLDEMWCRKAKNFWFFSYSLYKFQGCFYLVMLCFNSVHDLCDVHSKNRVMEFDFAVLRASKDTRLLLLLEFTHLITSHAQSFNILLFNIIFFKILSIYDNIWEIFIELRIFRKFCQYFLEIYE